MLTKSPVTVGKLLSYEYVAIGQDPTDANPGDILLCHRFGFASACIRGYERFHFKGGDRWSHVACFRSADCLTEALTRGVVETQPQAYRFIECVHVRTNLSVADGVQARKFLDACVGMRYGWVTIGGLPLRALTPTRGPVLLAGGTKICSGLAAEMLTRGGYVFSVEPAAIMPAELAIDLGVPPTLGEAREVLTGEH